MPFLCHLAIFVPGGVPSARPRVPGSPDPCLPVLFPIQGIFLGPLPGAELRPLVLSFRISYSGTSSDTARRPPHSPEVGRPKSFQLAFQASPRHSYLKGVHSELREGLEDLQVSSGYGGDGERVRTELARTS